MKRHFVALLLAALLLACAACTSPPNVLDASSSPLTEPSVSPDVSSDPAELSHLADFQDKKITIGGQDISPTVLEFYYNAVVSDFLSSNYNYIDQMGLSLDIPFSEQACVFDESLTWQDYFYSGATYRLHAEYATGLEAGEIGMTLTDKDEADMQSIIQSYEETYADAEGIDANIQDRFGERMSFDLFKELMRVSFVATRWQMNIEDAVSYTDEDLRGAFASDEEFEAANYNTVSVRHILVQDEATAGQVLDEWKKTPTEDNFAALVPQYTQDPGSSVTGGLYESIAKGQMVPDFEAWCFDTSRQPGDTGIVQTEHGYHVMYFSSVGEPAWKLQGQYTLISELLEQKTQEVMDKFPMTIV